MAVGIKIKNPVRFPYGVFYFMDLIGMVYSAANCAISEADKTL